MQNKKKSISMPVKIGAVACAVMIAAGAAAGIGVGAKSVSTPAAKAESATVSVSTLSKKSPAKVTSVAKKATAKKAVATKAAAKKTWKPVSVTKTAVKSTGLPSGYQKSFAYAYKVNKRVAAQFYVPGTKLSYYIPLAPNNSYYLNRGFNNAKYIWGNIFLDYRCSVAPWSNIDNLVMYGHSDDKKTLQLSAIKKYQTLNFYKQHPVVTFNTVYKNAQYKVIGLFLENVDMKKSFQYHNALHFANKSQFNSFVYQVKGRSFISMPVDCQYGDKFITFSTCLSTKSHHSRYVMVARRIRSGESSYVNVSQAKVNTKRIPASGPLN